MVKGTQTVINNLKASQTLIIKVSADKVGETIKEIWYDIRENAALTDHSLKDLREMNHPYSAANPLQIHEPSWLVHKQGGDLLKSIKYELEQKGKQVISGKIFTDTAIAPHALFVIMGTRYMIPRNFMWNTVVANLNKYKATLAEAESSLK